MNLENAQSKVGHMLSRVQILKECLLRYSCDPAYLIQYSGNTLRQMKSIHS